MSNLLALPLVRMTVATGNNEDWIDAIKYIVPSAIVDDPNPPQVDLRGIDFEMEIRRSAEDHEVVLSANSQDGSLAIGSSPDVGYLIIYITADIMKMQIAGDYVGDIVGRDELYARKIIELTLTIVQGITKWPSPA
jgi:hypothetical protein